MYKREQSLINQLSERIEDIYSDYPESSNAAEEIAIVLKNAIDEIDEVYHAADKEAWVRKSNNIPDDSNVSQITIWEALSS